jgi:hypothetical protein
MGCEQIQERFVELVYDEPGGALAADTEIQEHLRACSSCREELEELRQTRRYLRLWKDEPPLRRVTLPGHAKIPRQGLGWKTLRYAGIAAMVALTFLALVHTEITWNKNGFSFSTQLFARQGREPDYYTKAELRNLMKRALDDSESRVNETNYTMMQKILDIVEQDHYMDLRLMRAQASRNQNKN